MLTKVIEQAKIDHFTKWFERADKIVIVSHVSPDGDAIGSSLGLYHFLDSQEKTVNVIVPNAFPDFLKWMPGSKDILLYDRYKEFADKLLAEADVICCLDFNALKRIEDMADAVAASPARKILINHHLYPERCPTRRFLLLPNWCSALFAGWAISTRFLKKVPSVSIRA
mgnify:CR=1 FL=1